MLSYKDSMIGYLFGTVYNQHYLVEGRVPTYILSWDVTVRILIYLGAKYKNLASFDNGQTPGPYTFQILSELGLEWYLVHNLYIPEKKNMNNSLNYISRRLLSQSPWNTQLDIL